MRNVIVVMVGLAIGLTGNAANSQGAAASPEFHPTPQGAQLDLQKSFHTRSPWRLVATEGPQVKDYGGNDAPGVVTLCLKRGSTGPCLPDPVAPQQRTPTPDDDVVREPHYLLAAKVVYPHGPRAAPFLLLVTGSLYSGDGDQAIATQLIRYDAGRDAFQRIYSKRTGHNNNQESRFIVAGPLRGSVITAEPQEHAPYAYWIEVNSLSPVGAYRPVLRYRSATHYGDGNPLAVIDSEMPTIERRLGLWKPGEALPVPATNGKGKACVKPMLKHAELWCA